MISMIASLFKKYKHLDAIAFCLQFRVENDLLIFSTIMYRIDKNLKSLERLLFLYRIFNFIINAKNTGIVSVSQLQKSRYS